MLAIMTGIAQTMPAATSKQSAPEPADSLRVSVITCYPGREVYELCGHSALRIRSEQFDSVWNYGLFDFNEPNFVYRFVKGETDYMVGGYPFHWFLTEYLASGRKVVEQELALTNDQASKLRRMLQVESLPQNRTYRYNYVRDNCVTRILDRLDSVAGQRIIYSDSVAHGSFRREMRSYHRNYPWYQFGIDLALGSGIDAPTTAREEMFAPIDAMNRIATAHTADGEPLVRKTVILSEGSDGATEGPTPWYLTPLFWCSAACVILLLCAWLDLRHGKLTRIVYALYYLILGLAGCVICFLVVFSDHEATSPNMMLLWLNPLALIVPALIWVRSMRAVVAGYFWLNLVVVSGMVLIWPFQKQSANPAFFPLMIADIVLSATYAIISYKKSYKEVEPTAPARKRKPRVARK